MEIEKLFEGLDPEIEELQDQMKVLFQENQRLATLIDDLQRYQEKNLNLELQTLWTRIQKNMKKIWIKEGL